MAASQGISFKWYVQKFDNASQGAHVKYDPLGYALKSKNSENAKKFVKIFRIVDTHPLKIGRNYTIYVFSFY